MVQLQPWLIVFALVGIVLLMTLLFILLPHIKLFFFRHLLRYRKTGNYFFGIMTQVNKTSNNFLTDKTHKYFLSNGSHLQNKRQSCLL